MLVKKFLFLLVSIFFLSINLQANQVVNKAKELGVLLSGKYIDESMKNNQGNMQFDFVTSDQVSVWVDWFE